MGGHSDPPRSELRASLDEALSDPELRELILSGGDPLVLDDAAFAEIVDRVAEAPQVETLRVHTRAPVHYPKRVSAELARILSSGKPAWVVVHYSHPVELRPESDAALDRLREAGLGLLNQSVLLRGVNDDAEVLAELFRGLYARHVKPYYLHHPDRTPGNAAFRLSLPAAWRSTASSASACPGRPCRPT